MKMAQFKKYIFWKPNTQKQLEFQAPWNYYLALDLSIKVPPPHPLREAVMGQSQNCHHVNSKSHS